MFTAIITIVLLSIVALGVWSHFDEKKAIHNQTSNSSSKKSHKKKKGNRPDLVIGNIESQFKTEIYSEKDLIVVYGKKHKLSDIISCELEQHTDGNNNEYEISTNTGNMVKRAVVGGVLAGGIGAVVGGTTASKTVKEKTPVMAAQSLYTIHLIKRNLSTIHIYQVKQIEALKIKVYFEQFANQQVAK